MQTQPPACDMISSAVRIDYGSVALPRRPAGCVRMCRSAESPQRVLCSSVKFQLEITLLLIAPWRQQSISAINNSGSACQSLDGPGGLHKHPHSRGYTGAPHSKTEI